MLLSCDDKHNIKVGETQHPVPALDRGKRVISHGGIPVLALDMSLQRQRLHCPLLL